MLQRTSLVTPLIVSALNTILQLVSVLTRGEVSGSNYVVINLKHEINRSLNLLSTFWYYLNRTHGGDYDVFVAHFLQLSTCLHITSSFASRSRHSDYRYLADLLFLYVFQGRGFKFSHWFQELHSR